MTTMDKRPALGTVETSPNVTRRLGVIGGERWPMKNVHKRLYKNLLQFARDLAVGAVAAALILKMIL